MGQRSRRVLVPACSFCSSSLFWRTRAKRHTTKKSFFFFFLSLSNVRLAPRWEQHGAGATSALSEAWAVLLLWACGFVCSRIFCCAFDRAGVFGCAACAALELALASFVGGVSHPGPARQSRIARQSLARGPTTRGIYNSVGVLRVVETFVGLWTMESVLKSHVTCASSVLTLSKVHKSFLETSRSREVLKRNAKFL